MSVRCVVALITAEARSPAGIGEIAGDSAAGRAETVCGPSSNLFYVSSFYPSLSFFFISPFFMCARSAEFLTKYCGDIIFKYP
jgi:hypothetical protein